MAVTVIGLALLFFVGHALNWMFVKTKIPDLLLLVALGYILGPVTGALQAEDFGKVGGVLSTVALIVILYEGGLHLSARDLLTSSLPAAAISIVGFTLIVLCGVAVAYGVAFQPIEIALLLGLGIGSTSSAIVIPMVKPLTIRENTKTILSLESAFTDVLAIVIFLVAVDSITSGQFSTNDLLVDIGPKTVSAGLIGLSSGVLWSFVKKKFGALLSMAFAGEAWALLTYGIIEITGHNGAIGVLALGFMLANLDLLPDWMKNQISRIPVSYNEMALLSELTFLLRTFFFIYLGLLVKFSAWSTVAIGLILAALIFVTRYVMVRLLFRPSRYEQLDAMVATAMGPRGLACAVLATIPVQRGVIGGAWLQDVIFSIIPISIFVTAVLVGLSENEKFRPKLARLFSRYKTSTEPTEVSTTQ